MQLGFSVYCHAVVPQSSHDCISRESFNKKWVVLSILQNRTALQSYYCLAFFLKKDYYYCCSPKTIWLDVQQQNLIIILWQIVARWRTQSSFLKTIFFSHGCRAAELFGWVAMLVFLLPAITLFRVEDKPPLLGRFWCDPSFSCWPFLLATRNQVV